jgi:hypothetical protein
MLLWEFVARFMDISLGIGSCLILHLSSAWFTSQVWFLFDSVDFSMPTGSVTFLALQKVSTK